LYKDGGVLLLRSKNAVVVNQLAAFVARPSVKVPEAHLGGFGKPKLPLLATYL
jgi:hypothetical protein